jgi:hypothetical protein
MRRLLTFLLSFLLLSAVLVVAQTAAVKGTVADSTGAVIPQATITARNLATNGSRTVESSATGTFTIPALPVGWYAVTAQKNGFQIMRFEKVELTVAQEVTLNVTLRPASVAEEVLVSAQTIQPVDLETAQVSNIVSEIQMQSMPLVTRDPYQLILLSPGTMQSNSRLGGFSVNGSRERDNNFLLDGLDNNDTSVPGIPGGLAALNPEATQEFRVITNNFAPEFGRNNGAIVDVVTKSGTNQYHGNAYWFGRYNWLGGARDFFNAGPDKQNPYVRNQFGYSFGGPIRKDKTFFFFNNEFQRFRTTLTNQSVVPTAAFKSGIFNYTDPETGVTYPVNLVNAASPNNPQGLTFDPVVQRILALYPEPNGPALDSIRGYFFYPSSSKQDVYNLTAKVDHRINDSHNLTLRYAYNNFKDPNAYHDEFLPGLAATASSAKVHNVAAVLTSTLRPTWINEFKAGFNRMDNPYSCTGLDKLNVGGTDAFGRGRDFLLPNIDGFGCIQLGYSNGQTRRTGTYSFTDNMTWAKGAHTTKFGAEFRKIFEDGFNDFYSRDQVTFNGYLNFGVPFADLNPATPCNANTGDGCEGPTSLQDMADMMYGIIDTENQAQFFNHAGTRTASDNRRFRQHEYGVFWQDSWKLKPNLTLLFGARYQFNGVPFEADNNLSNLFANPAGAAPFTFSMVGPGTGRLLYNNDFSNLEPRVGFNWDPFKNGRTSIRGGFGMFHDRIFGNLFGNARGNPPFQQTYFSIPFSTPGGTPMPPTQISTAVVEDGAGITPVLFANNLRMPVTENWNLGLQHELARNLTLEVNYVGTRGLHLLRVLDGNPPNPALVAQHLAAGVAPADLQFASLYFGDASTLSVFNNAFWQASLNLSNANSYYHGIQANLTRRMSHGLQLQAAYTYSHSIDDGNDPIDAAAGARNYPRNSYDLRAERGSSDFDLRNRLVLNYVWQMPIGRGQSFAHAGIVGKVLEGFSLSGISTFQSGHPFEVFGDRDAEHTGLSSRLDLIGAPSIPAGSPRFQTGPVADAFALPQFGFPGSVGRNRFTGPTYYNTDLVLAKGATITERVKMELRWEVYNILNRTQFAQPDNLLQDGASFGQSNSTLTRADSTTSARQMQLGLKLSF